MVVVRLQTITMIMLFLPSSRQSARAFSSIVDVANRCDRRLYDDILYRIRAVNHVPPDLALLNFCVDGSVLGQVRPNIAECLCKNGSAFCIQEGNKNSILTFSSTIDSSVESRTEAVGTVMGNLRDQGLISGWRDELYPIASSFYDPPAFLMERAAVKLLGALEYGVHVNGIVRSEDGTERMWIGRRSPTKSKFPNMLDHIAAGGQPAGLGLRENVMKECYEEAGIPEELTGPESLKAAGGISYRKYLPDEDAMERVVLFNYDLYLPPSFQPKPVDGEVSEFVLMEMSQILDTMDRDHADPIKPNCYSVIIDFLQRHGYLNPEVPGYLEILQELRAGDCR